MVDRNQAEQLFWNKMIPDPSYRHNFVISHVLERDYGWVFILASKKRAEGDKTADLTGSTPVLVFRIDGRIVGLGLAWEAELEKNDVRYSKLVRPNSPNIFLRALARFTRRLPRSKRDEALIEAVLRNDASDVIRCIQSGSDPNARYWTKADHWRLPGSPPILNFFGLHVRPWIPRWTVLMIAIYRCDLTIIEYLIQSGADVRATAISGSGPRTYEESVFDWAVAADRSEIIELLRKFRL
jgi:hypothetical protein